VKDSAIADAEIGIDEYGVYYLTITGKENGSSSVEAENSEGKSVIIDFEVIPKAAEAITDIPETGVLSMGWIFGICAIITASAAFALRKKSTGRMEKPEL
jgi:hypothetical protein